MNNNNYEIKSYDGRFYIGDYPKNTLGEITYYHKDDKTIVIDHTYVDPKQRGNGLARLLIDAVVDYAQEKDFKIIPVCSYAVKVLNADPIYKEILK